MTTLARCLPTLALVAALPVGTASAAELPAAEMEWLRVDTEHFDVYSNATEDKTRQFTESFERFRMNLDRLFPGDGGDEAVPTRVFIFSSARSFKPYNRRTPGGKPSSSAGYCALTPIANYIAVDASPGMPHRRLVYHEYTHHFVDSRHVGLPLWFREGFAEYLSVTGFANGEVVLGRPIDDSLEALRQNRWLPLRVVLTLSSERSLYTDPEHAKQFYAQSWLIVHYVLHGCGDRSLTPDRLLELRRPGRPLDQAVLESLAMDEGELERALREYAGQASFGTRSVPLSFDAGVVPPPTPVDPETVLTRLGELLSFAHRDYAMAERHFRAALEIREDLADAHAGLGYVLEVQERADGGGQQFAQAKALNRGDARSHFMNAFALLEVCRRQPPEVLWDGEEPLGGILEARSLLDKALELDPNLLGARVALGDTYLYSPEDPSPGIEVYEKLSELHPAMLDVAGKLAVLYVRAGRVEDGDALLETVERGAHDQDLFEWARNWVRAAKRGLVVEFGQRGEIDKAIQLMESMVAESDDFTMRGIYEQRLEQLRSHALRGRQIKEYNRAVALAHDRKHREALAILAELEAAGVEDPGLADLVTGAADQLRLILGQAKPRDN